MTDLLLFSLIVLPFVSGLACYFVRVSAVRSVIVMTTCAALGVSSLVFSVKAPGTYELTTLYGLNITNMIHLADYGLLVLMFLYGVKYRSQLIKGFSLIQFIMLLVFGLFMSGDHEPVQLYMDELAIIMVLIVSVIGSVICVYAIPYMKNHEIHLNLKKSKQPRFFMILIMFLGAMNGLVLSSDLLVFYFFFEVTTLCSFLLIGHDQTKEAIKNSVTALWMNSLGGVVLLSGIILSYLTLHTLDIQTLIREAGSVSFVLLPLGLLCFAGFVKAAQMPLQGWLLGAMVAPTPTSALLHSSTMVKAGVYLVIRLAPAYSGTFLSTGIALCGAFTFLATAALAIGQSNGKKVLAYSTISNLGLIIACAGINTEAAITAATLLIIFHAISKALLFLCVGTIEQHIGSRDIEDMRGLFSEMPKTSVVITLAVLTMILPPFGMLLGKWMAIESASGNLFVIIMLSLGSAVTVVYWARWAGVLLGSDFTGESKPEKHSPLTMGSLFVLLTAAILFSFFSPFIYLKSLIPALSEGLAAPFSIIWGSFTSSRGAFMVIPLFLIILILGYVIKKVTSGSSYKISQPYMSGINGSETGTYVGPMNKICSLKTSNYYLKSFFGEEKLTPWFNRAAIVLIILMIGGAL